MADISAAPNGNYTHYAQCYVTGWNVGGGYASVHYKYWVHRNVSAGNGAWYNSPRLFRMTVHDGTYDNNTSYDFRTYADRTFIEGDRNIGLGGPATIGFSLYFQGHITGTFPSASASGGLFIPWTPGVPNGLGFDQILPTSMRYRFNGTTDGGSGITGWQAQIATDPGFTQNLQTVGSDGTTTFGGLTPATVYYARSRGSNAIGWGAWSSVQSAMTASGAYVSLNATWVPVPAYVSNGTTWNVPKLQISDGTAWEDAI